VLEKTLKAGEAIIVDQVGSFLGLARRGSTCAHVYSVCPRVLVVVVVGLLGLPSLRAVALRRAPGVAGGVARHGHARGAHLRRRLRLLLQLRRRRGPR